MFKRANWLFMWLIGAVTLGIYQIVGWCRMCKQQNMMAERLGEKKVMHFLIALVLGALTCGIVPVFWLLAFCKQQKILAQAKGIDLFPTSNAFLLWLLTFVPILRIFIACTNHNKLCDVFEE